MRAQVKTVSRRLFSKLTVPGSAKLATLTTPTTYLATFSLSLPVTTLETAGCRLSMKPEQSSSARTQTQWINSSKQTYVFLLLLFLCCSLFVLFLTAWLTDWCAVCYYLQQPAAFEAVFVESCFKSYRFKIRAKAEEHQQEQRVKCHIMEAKPLDYAAESKWLLDQITLLQGQLQRM